MFRSVFMTIFRGSFAVLCAFTIPPSDLRSLSLYYYAVCGRGRARACVCARACACVCMRACVYTHTYICHTLYI